MAQKVSAVRVASEKSGKVLLYILISYIIAGLIALLADPKIIEYLKDYPWSVPLIGIVNVILVWLKKYLENR